MIDVAWAAPAGVPTDHRIVTLRDWDDQVWGDGGTHLLVPVTFEGDGVDPTVAVDPSPGHEWVSFSATWTDGAGVEHWGTDGCADGVVSVWASPSGTSLLAPTAWNGIGLYALGAPRIMLNGFDYHGSLYEFFAEFQGDADELGRAVYHSDW
jgi:hypothetical protein